MKHSTTGVNDMDYADKPRMLLPHGNDVAIPVYDIGHSIGPAGQCLPGGPIGYRIGPDGRPEPADIGFVVVPR